MVDPSNLVTFAKVVSERWKRFTGELVGDPQNEEDFLKERSPINYVNNTNPTTGLSVIQGANDPRVVKNESDHGITKYSNLLKALKRSAELVVERLYYNG
jgi:dipeptidyl aminopeptidase/acylaminoacyl peptidase